MGLTGLTRLDVKKMIEKTEYKNSGKIVLSDGYTGLMISSEYYEELIGMGYGDQEIFEGAI